MATSKLPEEKAEPGRKCSKTNERLNQILPTLPKEKGWMAKTLVQYKGFWMAPEFSLLGLLLIEDHFKAQTTDIYLASSPKAGTTWLKSLIFATVNRKRFDFSANPLLKTNPHDLFPFLERYIQQNEWASSLECLPSPRLLSTHLPYSLLPESLALSGCKFVYICRDPKDLMISLTHFVNNTTRKTQELPTLTLDEAFDSFCKGTSPYGPYWDHVLGYWKASLENPERILFLKYEDLKREPLLNVKKLAEFLGQPFSFTEENEGVVEEIIRLCSFQNLSNLDVNKASESSSNIRIPGNKTYFRKGEIGDWKNHLTPEMAAYIDGITEEKFQGAGFSFG
ncbi:hypothetical protein ACFE04_007119 [Oxalis oulophora]